MGDDGVGRWIRDMDFLCGEGGTEAKWREGEDGEMVGEGYEG